jgi:hypothetical protein
MENPSSRHRLHAITTIQISTASHRTLLTHANNTQPDKMTLDHGRTSNQWRI